MCYLQNEHLLTCNQNDRFALFFEIQCINKSCYGLNNILFIVLLTYYDIYIHTIFLGFKSCYPSVAF